MLLALAVSLLAGLATTVGGVMATHRKFQDRQMLAVGLAFAAGAMIFVSLVEMLPLGVDSMHRAGVAQPTWWVLATFFVGMGLVALIDRLLPSGFNPSHIEGRESRLSGQDKKDNRALMRSGLMVAVVLALHNFPEGMSTFIASYQDISVGLTLALAIAIHNIPEGIAVAAPVFAATGSRRKAVRWATISGLTEPLGALVAAALISYLVPPAFFGVLFGLVAGMMVFISFDELLPAAQRYASRFHYVVYGLAGGMAIVALSLLLTPAN